jgi:type IV secretion system protein VirB10
VSEQENKIPTAVEIERELRERRQKELEEANKEVEQQDTSQPAKTLGIEKLKKSRKGMIIVIVAFLLLAVGMCFYYVPSIIRSFSSSDEKQPSQTVATGSVKRQTGLSDDVDPFNQSQKTEDKKESTESSGKGDTEQAKPDVPQQRYSRALDVTYGSSVTQSESSSGASQQAKPTGDEQDVNSGAQGSSVEPIKQSPSVSLSEIKRVPYDPNLFIPEGTAIKCSLDRRFVSDLAGKLVCTINEDVYSANGNVKLIERGTAAHLMYKSGTFRHGQGAVFIMATKLRTREEPFLDIPLVDTQAAGALGEAGASGWIDTHFSDRFVGSMMFGVIPDFAQAASGAAKNNKDNQTDYTANSRQAFADIARESFSNSLNIPPTLYKNQGEIITLIVGQDLDFSKVYKLKLK